MGSGSTSRHLLTSECVAEDQQDLATIISSYNIWDTITRLRHPAIPQRAPEINSYMLLP